MLKDSKNQLTPVDWEIALLTVGKVLQQAGRSAQKPYLQISHFCKVSRMKLNIPFRAQYRSHRWRNG